MTPANASERTKSINDAMGFIGPRFYSVIDNAYTRGDIIENGLKQSNNYSRLFEFFFEICTVIDIPE